MLQTICMSSSRGTKGTCLGSYRNEEKLPNSKLKWCEAISISHFITWIKLQYISDLSKWPQQVHATIKWHSVPGSVFHSEHNGWTWVFLGFSGEGFLRLQLTIPTSDFTFARTHNCVFSTAYLTHGSWHFASRCTQKKMKSTNFLWGLSIPGPFFPSDKIITIQEVTSKR